MELGCRALQQLSTAKCRPSSCIVTQWYRPELIGTASYSVELVEHYDIKDSWLFDVSNGIEARTNLHDGLRLTVN